MNNATTIALTAAMSQVETASDRLRMNRRPSFRDSPIDDGYSPALPRPLVNRRFTSSLPLAG